jgi:hypothetical protein
MTIAAAMATLSERNPGCNGTLRPRRGLTMYLLRHSGAFPAQEKNILGREPEIGVADIALCRQEDQASRLPLLQETAPKSRGE